MTIYGNYSHDNTLLKLFRYKFIFSHFAVAAKLNIYSIRRSKARGQVVLNLNYDRLTS